MNVLRRLCLLLPGNSIQHTEYDPKTDQTKLYLKWLGWVNENSGDHTVLPEGGEAVHKRLTHLLDCEAVVRAQPLDMAEECRKLLREIKGKSEELRYVKNYTVDNIACDCEGAYHKPGCHVPLGKDAPSSDAAVKRYKPQLAGLSKWSEHGPRAHMVEDEVGKWMNSEEVSRFFHTEIAEAERLLAEENLQEQIFKQREYIHCLKRMMARLGIKDA